MDALVEKVKSMEIDSSSVSVFGMPVNPVAILPTVAGQLSDEMLENIADMLLIVSDDIRVIRANRKPLK